jgi:predicted Zn-dependent protease
MRRLAAAAAFLLWLMAGVAWADASPLTGRADLARIGEEERRLWDESEEFDRLLGLAGLVDPDPEATAYLQRVMDGLFPEFDGSLKVRILVSPVLNAFCLPNGSIYINRGLLARFDNEAQLAAVLAHEGGHFTHRHSHQQQELTKTLALVQLASAVFGLPYPWARDLLLRSSMFGYARSMETEADEVSHSRLRKAGYDEREGIKVFEHLAAELKASDIKEPYFFSTHPRLAERVENFKRMGAESATGGRLDKDGYLEHFAGLRLGIFDADLALHRPGSVLAALEEGKRAADYPPQAHYYLGEAWRLRGREGDADRAEQSYRESLARAPDFALAHYGLGLIYQKRKQWRAARESFAAFLTAGDQAARHPGPAAFAREYLSLAERKLAEGAP